jgi:surfeit locus 1 family protein
MFRLFFSRRWWWTTLLVIAVVGVALRLAFWQVQRFGRRQALNAELAHHMEEPPLTLGADLDNPGEPLDLLYRPVIVRGRYDYSQEIAVIDIIRQNQQGAHLITPLIVEGSDRAVLVDRGWIPYADAAPDQWPKYAEPGVVEVKGMIWLSDNGLRASAQSLADSRWWFRADVEQIQAVVSYPLLPFYIRQSPAPDFAGPPYRDEPEVDLTANRHLTYIIFWSSLAAMLGIGYVSFVRSMSRSPSSAERSPRLVTRKAES